MSRTFARLARHPAPTARAARLLAPLLREPGTVGRRVLEKLTGVASERLLPLPARRRFSERFVPAGASRRVVLFPTCVVEHAAPRVGLDLAAVFARNGIGCDVAAAAGCCGRASLDVGDATGFRANAAATAALLAAAVRTTHAPVVVAQPRCLDTIRRDWLARLAGADAALVAAHAVDPSEHLLASGVDTTFCGKVPAEVTFHPFRFCEREATTFVAGRSQNGKGWGELLALPGCRVTVVEGETGLESIAGFSTDQYEQARRACQPLAQAVVEAGGDVIAADDVLDGLAIEQETGERVTHPLSVLARAYGIPEDDE